jgi:hypothetical protein
LQKLSLAVITKTANEQCNFSIVREVEGIVIKGCDKTHEKYCRLRLCLERKHLIIITKLQKGERLKKKRKKGNKNESSDAWLGVTTE